MSPVISGQSPESTWFRAAIAHLYFESIHPFEDGNGRMGRVLAEKALAQTTGFPNLTSLSITIERNKKVIDRMFEAGPSGFQGGMTASKYSRLARVSKATATRHLADLAQKGALVREGRSKSTRCHIAELDPWSYSRSRT